MNRGGGVSIQGWDLRYSCNEMPLEIQISAQAYKIPIISGQLSKFLLNTRETRTASTSSKKGGNYFALTRDFHVSWALHSSSCTVNSHVQSSKKPCHTLRLSTFAAICEEAVTWGGRNLEEVKVFAEWSESFTCLFFTRAVWTTCGEKNFFRHF